MKGETDRDFHESHFVPFKNAFRPSPGPYECADVDSNQSRIEETAPNIFTKSNVIRSETAASVGWGPNCTKKCKNAGFPGFGATISDHPRIYPDHQIQGLTGPYPLPRRTVDPLARADYDSQTKAALKSLCEKRKLLVGGNKPVLVARLKQYDDDEIKKNAAVEAGDGNDGMADKDDGEVEPRGEAGDDDGGNNAGGSADNSIDGGEADNDDGEVEPRGEAVVGDDDDDDAGGSADNSTDDSEADHYSSFKASKKAKLARMRH